MCGIVGSIEAATPRRDKLIAEMCAEILHRGPDDMGVFGDDRVSIAMRRLSIIDVEGGAQPVFDESGRIAVVFNGEIYNFRELQDDLRSKGHQLASESDSECIPHLYEEYGLSFVEKLQGMFAIALWDARTGRLVLVRDRLGKKPLYFRHDANGFAFASEFRALLVDERTTREIDEEALSHYLTYQYVPAPWSIYRTVRKLPPGHLAVWRDGELEVRTYWQLKFGPATRGAQIDEVALADELRERLKASVRSRLVSERPLGAFLSGGLDSSAIVAAMSEVAPGTVKTFSIGFDEDAYNELPFAREVAERYGTEHHERIVRPDALEVLPKLASVFGEPYADSSAIPSYYLAKMAHEHVVVSLNGDGGDEAFGGYNRYPAFLQSEAPRWVRAVAPAAKVTARALRTGASRSRHLARVQRVAGLVGESSPVRRYGRMMSYFDEEAKRRVLSPEARRRLQRVDSYELIKTVWDANIDTDLVNRILAVDTSTYLPGDLLAKVDMTTMAVSLEARSPLLDHTFMEWAATLPGDLKVRNGQTKYLFKKALEPWLSPELVNRRKQGFGVPLGEWLRGPLREMVKDLLPNGRAVKAGFLNAAEVQALIDQHLAGIDHAPRLYALLMLELWFGEVHDMPTRVPS